MADTPEEGGAEPVKRPRKPRTPRETPAAAPKTGTRGRRKATPPTTVASDVGDAVATVRKKATDGTKVARKAATNAGRRVSKVATDAAKPANAKRLAVGAAAVAGVAAGVTAMVLGRKKIVQASNDVIDSVTTSIGNIKSPEPDPQTPTSSAS